MAHSVLYRARQELLQCDLVAFASPLYPVLALDQPPLGLAPGTPSMTAADTPMAIKDMFKDLAETRSCLIIKVFARSNTSMHTRD